MDDMSDSDGRNRDDTAGERNEPTPTGYRGTALHRGADVKDEIHALGEDSGRGADVRRPPTAEPGEAGREIVRFLLGTDGEALFTEIAAHLPAVEREELQRAVGALEEAGIVSVDPGYGEPRVRLQLPVDKDVFEEA